jgi:hypothetical protein
MTNLIALSFCTYFALLIVLFSLKSTLLKGGASLEKQAD